MKADNKFPLSAWLIALVILAGLWWSWRQLNHSPQAHFTGMAKAIMRKEEPVSHYYTTSYLQTVRAIYAETTIPMDSALRIHLTSLSNDSAFLYSFFAPIFTPRRPPVVQSINDSVLVAIVNIPYKSDFSVSYYCKRSAGKWQVDSLAGYNEFIAKRSPFIYSISKR